MPLFRTSLRWFSALAVMAATPAVAVQPASDPALNDTSGCSALIDIVQESLRGEIDVVCPKDGNEACEAKNGQIRALLDIVDERRKRKADECETLVQVNRLLRTLPPKT
ncbi:hypothetical protein D9X30_5545 [Cupriavidus sp. U2]|uniref:hypothetical protein n=1 Tax=Cupriavidus sp. U2 TaxID=2920269 RepID=UPI00129EE07D|nr:hypothetical protein [Cupriavidus sp. U2]KAI3589962.1 hypothetical protein D9X30_5545 [Cupriavidus sp. U2]